mmetsp:Transcript_62446/g.136521  ORF Transcript_62446/g.136521 Transcript_62446/m.136521 type:complete len:128 (-) Transcript_62446:1589-1972(-)
MVRSLVPLLRIRCEPGSRLATSRSEKSCWSDEQNGDIMSLCTTYGPRALRSQDSIGNQVIDLLPRHLPWARPLLPGASCHLTCHLNLMATILTLLGDMDRRLHPGLGIGQHLESLIFRLHHITLGCR